MADVEGAFVEFMDKVPFYGACMACADDPLLAAILPRVRRRVFTYGAAPEADFRLEFLAARRRTGAWLACRSRFEVARGRRVSGPVGAACARAAQRAECDGCGGHRGAA